MNRQAQHRRSRQLRVTRARRSRELLFEQLEDRRLLTDIAHEKNHLFIRNLVDAADNRNIRPGTMPAFSRPYISRSRDG